MEKIKYVIVHAADVEKLADVVNDAIQKDYEPFGSVFSAQADGVPAFYQPMVKKGQDKTPEEVIVGGRRRR